MIVNSSIYTLILIVLSPINDKMLYCNDDGVFMLVSCMLSQIEIYATF